jgi:hypothetical protein
MLSMAGTTLLLCVGFSGLGLTANAIIWPFIALFAYVAGQQNLLPTNWLLVLSVPGIPLGVLMAGLGISRGLRLRERGRRLRARDARPLLQRPGEPPVLLLRSFDDEELEDPRPIDVFMHRYEESLSRALSQLGPVITIGRPNDSLGFGGAARLYVSDAYWQKAVHFLMTHAAAVVIVFGRTEGLWWEIGTASKVVCRERLLFFFPYVHKFEKRRSPIADLKETFGRWNLPRRRYQKMDEERRERYRAFLQRGAQHFGNSLPPSLEDALFFDFLPDGHVRLLKSRYPVSPYAFFFNIFHLFFRHWRHLQFDMARTLWPFISKLYQLAG